MRKIGLVFLLFFLSFSCSRNKTKKPTSKAKKQDHFYITGNISNYNDFKVFLYRQNNNGFKKTDSFLIKNKQFYFKGNIVTPERAIIAFEKKTGQIPIILSNDSIAMHISIKDLSATKIVGSILTQELAKIQKKSIEIFTEIDYLYPKFQKARLENNSKALYLISKKIKDIKIKNNTFLLDYASKNTDSYIAPILLNDVIQNDTFLLPKIKTIYRAFTPEIKQSKAAKAIALRFTNLKK